MLENYSEIYLGNSKMYIVLAYMIIIFNIFAETAFSDVFLHEQENPSIMMQSDQSTFWFNVVLHKVKTPIHCVCVL